MIAAACIQVISPLIARRTIFSQSR